jgi:hypothetical protein
VQIGLIHPILPEAGEYAVEVSVIFGTYNRRSYLERCVASVRAACKGISYEIVVGDGGSTDGSREWLLQQPDIVCVDAGLNGAVAAFNACFAKVRGRFTLTLNDDATLHADAVANGLVYLRDPMVGQVAFAFRVPSDPTYKVQCAVGYPYANYGLVRTNVARTIATLCGGLWSTAYRTYGGDNELSLWVLRLGYKIAAANDARVDDLFAQDDLRKRSNTNTQRNDSGKTFASRWPPKSIAFRGPAPNVGKEAQQRLALLEAGEVPAIRWPRLRGADPELGQFPPRKTPTKERVVHVYIKTAEDPQASMAAAFASLGPHASVDWIDARGSQVAQRVVAAIRHLSPTLVFMQLQGPGVVDLAAIKAIRHATHDPSLVLALWSGDVGPVNGPWPGLQDAWSHQYAALVDVMLYTGTGQVQMQRSRGMQNAAYLQIGYDEERYFPGAPEQYGTMHDVVFLGQNYGPQWAAIPNNDAGVRREAVEAFSRCFRRAGIYGGGWKRGSAVLHQGKAGDVYRKSLLALSISLTSNLGRYSSDRLMRAMACGTTPLVKRFADMEGLGIRHRENALVWDTVPEAVALAHEWLAPDRRAELLSIGRNAATLMREHHTWNVRMQELASITSALRGQL